ENGLSVGSLATGFKNLGEDIVEYLMPVFDRLLGILYKIITLDLEGAWEEVKSLGSDSVDWVTQKTKDAWGSIQNWWNGVEERAPEAFDKAAQIQSSDEASLTQQSKNAGFVDTKKGFSKGNFVFEGQKSAKGLTQEETGALAAQMVKRESGGNLRAENQYGYLGLYQFGAAALVDAGLI
ncbi:peptidoglycan-binding protein LysM, partial [Glaesserella parasuis]|nr:peptidoglycan-binding protein LysM [Glaesserella parasuis]